MFAATVTAPFAQGSLFMFALRGSSLYWGEPFHSLGCFATYPRDSKTNPPKGAFLLMLHFEIQYIAQLYLTCNIIYCILYTVICKASNFQIEYNGGEECIPDSV